MDAIGSAKAIHKKVVEWRRELHRIPETDFDLVKTSQFVKDRLDEFGVEHRVMGRTGVVGLVREIKDSPTIALRADMDALPINEETGLPFASKNGKMHACGHDAHTAMLLGVARILSENRESLKGNVKLVFQPAEETTGGAKPMIEEGCLENPKVDAIFGLHIGHLFREVGNGQIGVRFGEMMAAVDSFIVKVRGRGGHGARPHQCVDPVTTAAEMIMGLQKIVSREIDPTHGAVVTVGMIKGGTTTNVIPEEVEFRGTIRTLNPDDRQFIEKRFAEMCSSIAEANRAKAEINYANYYPAVINDEEMTRVLAGAAAKIVGEEDVVEIRSPSMGAEDMAYYLQRTRGSFCSLGSGKKDGNNEYPHHHPKFDIDEDVLWIGPALFVQTVLDLSDGMI